MTVFGLTKAHLGTYNCQHNFYDLKRRKFACLNRYW